jgi:hypothetical protein
MGQDGCCLCEERAGPRRACLRHGDRLARARPRQAASAWRFRRQSARPQAGRRAARPSCGSAGWHEGAPLMTTDYTPTLPEGMELPKGASINVDHPDYKALTAVAREEGWSQKSFSRVLALEAQRHERTRAPQPPSVPAPAPKIDYAKLSTTEKFQLALERSAAKRNGG